MINQVMLVGRLTKTPELFYTETGKKGSFITLAVGRAFKNPEGKYDTDYLDCTLWTGIAENTAEYCKKGDIIGVRGRIQSRIIENEDGTKYKRMEIVAEKVTFLSSNNGKKNDDINILDLKEDDDVLEDDNSDEKEKKKNNKKN